MKFFHSCVLYFVLLFDQGDGSPIKIVDLRKDAFYRITQANKGINLQDTDINVKEKHRKKRAVLSNVYWEWINGTVPYAFDTVNPVKLSIKEMTLAVFRHIETHTCIRFIPRTNQVDYINVTDASGCWSYLGRTRGMQELVLQSVCENFEVITHEVLHALGFLHEHKRPDRDLYVTVNYTNIQPGISAAFDIYNETHLNGISTQNLSYDKLSVMHYTRFTFTIWSNNGFVVPKPEYMTIYANGNPDEIIGSQDGLSFLDKVRINKRYGCNITVPNQDVDTTVASPSSSNSPIYSNVPLSSEQASTTPMALQTTSTITTTGKTTTATTSMALQTTSTITTTGKTTTATTSMALQTTSTITTTGKTTTAKTLQINPTNSSSCGSLTSVCKWGEPDDAKHVKNSLFITILFEATIFALIN